MELKYNVPKDVRFNNSNTQKGEVVSMISYSPTQTINFPNIKLSISTYSYAYVRIKFKATSYTGDSHIGFESSDSWRLFFYNSSATYYDGGGEDTNHRKNLYSYGYKLNNVYNLLISDSSIRNFDTDTSITTTSRPSRDDETRAKTLTIGRGIEIYELDVYYTTSTTTGPDYVMRCRPKANENGEVGLYDSVNDTWYMNPHESDNKRVATQWENVKAIDFGGADVMFAPFAFQNNPTITRIENVNIKNGNSSDPVIGNGDSMFANCINLEYFKGNFIYPSANLNNVFNGCYNLKTFISDKPIPNGSLTMFNGCYNLTEFVADFSEHSVNLNDCKKIQYSYDGMNVKAGLALYNLPKSGTLDLRNITKLSSFADMQYMAYNTENGNCTLQIPSSTLSDLKGNSRLHIANRLLDKGYTISGYTRINPSGTYADCNYYEVRDDTTEFNVIGYDDANNSRKNVYYLTHSLTNDELKVNFTSGVVASFYNISNRPIKLKGFGREEIIPYNMDGSYAYIGVEYDYVFYRADTVLILSNGISQDESNPTNIAIVAPYSSSYAQRLTISATTGISGYVEFHNYSLYDAKVNAFGTTYDIPIGESVTAYVEYKSPRQVTLQDGETYQLTANDFGTQKTIVTVLGSFYFKGEVGLVSEPKYPNIAIKGEGYNMCTGYCINADGSQYDERISTHGTDEVEWKDATFYTALYPDGNFNYSRL